MLGFISAALVGMSAIVSAAPVVVPPGGPGLVGFNPFPLADGFDGIKVSDEQLRKIEERAGGTLPQAAKNAPPPSNPGKDGLVNLQLIALNEISEVAFFTQLIEKISSNANGFTTYPKGYEKQDLLRILDAVVAQEELHALNAQGALQKFGLQPIQPCRYNFPFTDLEAAIAFAQTFTDVVLGTLQDVQFIFANNNDAGLVRAVGSVIGQEGQQDGFYRLFQGKNPSAQPFLTTSVRDFAFTALLSFTIGDGATCPNVNTIPLENFAALTVVTDPKTIKPGDQSITYKIDLADLKHQNVPCRSAEVANFNWDPNHLPSLVLINGQNAPITEKIRNVKKISDTVFQFDADFPQASQIMDGLTIAALVRDTEDFATADDVAKKAVFAPAFLEVN
jgi:hypothetical protein